jgi:hypothetical protein
MFHHPKTIYSLIILLGFCACSVFAKTASKADPCEELREKAKALSKKYDKLNAELGAMDHPFSSAGMKIRKEKEDVLDQYKAALAAVSDCEEKHRKYGFGSEPEHVPNPPTPVYLNLPKDAYTKGRENAEEVSKRIEEERKRKADEEYWRKHPPVPPHPATKPLPPLDEPQPRPGVTLGQLNTFGRSGPNNKGREQEGARSAKLQMPANVSIDAALKALPKQVARPGPKGFAGGGISYAINYDYHFSGGGAGNYVIVSDKSILQPNKVWSGNCTPLTRIGARQYDVVSRYDLDDFKIVGKRLNFRIGNGRIVSVNPPQAQAAASEEVGIYNNKRLSVDLP